MADAEEQRKRQARFEQWEKLGLDQVKHDLLNGGYRVVGGSPQVRKLAWEWVRMKEAEQTKAAQKTDEILTLKPSLWGIGLNLKELWRQIRRRSAKAAGDLSPPRIVSSAKSLALRTGGGSAIEYRIILRQEVEENQ